jgi:N-acylneuraminate cytidylyltransferase
VAVIPARGGSKGIPRKNIKPLAGKPLIAWSIDAAKLSKLVDRVVVSTEDPEIASVARGCGAEILERPAELAGDKSSTLSVLLHVYANIPCDAMIVLQPTSPVRMPGLLDDCIGEFQRAEADSLATGWWCTYAEYGTNTKPRQDIRGFFYDDGNVYVISGNLLKKGERYGTNIVRKVVSREENIDIDDEFDFWLAEKIILERMND